MSCLALSAVGSRSRGCIIADEPSEDPAAWGYSKMPTDSDEKEDGGLFFVPLANPQLPPPFQLELIGKDDGSVQIPLPLRSSAGAHEPVVIITSDVDYPEFYDAISRSVCLQFCPRIAAPANNLRM